MSQMLVSVKGPDEGSKGKAGKQAEEEEEEGEEKEEEMNPNPGKRREQLRERIFDIVGDPYYQEQETYVLVNAIMKAIDEA